MRLIDADALLENYNLKDATKYGNETAELMWHSYDTMMMYEIADMIEEAPTVAAEPVVHGEWEILTDEYDCEYMRCSACNEEFYPADEDTVDKLYNYCPNCSAKMDGKSKV